MPGVMSHAVTADAASSATAQGYGWGVTWRGLCG